MSLASLNPKEARQVRDFNDRMQRLAEGTLSISETDAARAARIRLNLDDIIAFSKDYLPHVATGEPGDFHRQFAKLVEDFLLLDDESERELAFRCLLEWARGHAKSAWIDLILPLYLLARGWLKFMVLASSTFDAAANLLEDIKEQLETNEKYISDFGEMANPGSWAFGDFSTRNGVRFRAMGVGQSPRGIRKKGQRPNLIVIDDIDKDATVRNEFSAKDIVDWIDGALIGSMQMGRGMVIFGNNRFHENCALVSFVGRPNYHHIKVNALDENGQPSWHQNFTLEEILFKMGEMDYCRAQSEYMNNPMVAGKIYKQEWIRYRPALPLNDYVALVAYSDPGYSKRSKTDYKVWVILGRRPDGPPAAKGGEPEKQFDVLAVYAKQGNPNAYYEWPFDFGAKLEDRCDRNFPYYIEGMFNQDNALTYFEAAGKRRGLRSPVASDPRGRKPKKQNRIKAMAAKWERGEIWFDEALRHDPDQAIDLRVIIAQLLSFDPSRERDPDDGPDALEGAIWHLDNSSAGFYAALNAGRSSRNESQRSRNNSNRERGSPSGRTRRNRFS